MLVFLRSFDSVVFLECELSCRREPLVKFHIVRYGLFSHLLDRDVSASVVGDKLLDRVLSVQDWLAMLRNHTVLIRLKRESDRDFLPFLLDRVKSLKLLLVHRW